MIIYQLQYLYQVYYENIDHYYAGFGLLDIWYPQQQEEDKTYHEERYFEAVFVEDGYLGRIDSCFQSIIFEQKMYIFSSSYAH